VSDFSAKFPFVKQLSAPGQRHFEQSSRPVTLKDKQLFLGEGELCQSVLFVESGALRVFKSAEQGREITLYRVKPGELCILSTASLLAQNHYPASVAAAGETRAQELSGDAFRALHESEPALQTLVAGQLHRLLSDVMSLVTEIAFRRVDERLAAHLLSEGNALGILETTHERLAQHLGTAREVVSRLLTNLRDDGVVALERGFIRVLDRSALAAVARIAV